MTERDEWMARYADVSSFPVACSGHRRSQGGLADPPFVIPPLVIMENLEQAGQLQTLGRRFNRIARQLGRLHHAERRHIGR